MQRVKARGGEVVHRAGLGLRDPQREPVRGDDRLNVGAVRVRLAGLPQVDDLAADSDGLRYRPTILEETPRCRQSRFRSVHAADGPRAESPRASPDVDVLLLILAVRGDRAVDRCDWRDRQLPGKLCLRPQRPRVRMGAG